MCTKTHTHFFFLIRRLCWLKIYLSLFQFWKKVDNFFEKKWRLNTPIWLCDFCVQFIVYSSKHYSYKEPNTNCETESILTDFLAGFVSNGDVSNRTIRSVEIAQYSTPQFIQHSYYAILLRFGFCIAPQYR